MNIASYHVEVARTMRPFTFTLTAKEMGLANYATGLAGEAGEVADEIKKALFHREADQPLQLENSKIVKELGDVLWYVFALANELGLNVEDIMRANSDKLRTRYPDGFSAADAAARRDVAT